MAVEARRYVPHVTLARLGGRRIDDRVLNWLRGAAAFRFGPLAVERFSLFRSHLGDGPPHYETLKHTGEYPIIGVNTFLSSKGSPTIIPGEVIRATKEEKEYQIKMLNDLHDRFESQSEEAIAQVKEAAIQNRNVFAELMEAGKVCSLGEITHSLFEVGGQYRRNM